MQKWQYFVSCILVVAYFLPHVLNTRFSKRSQQLADQVEFCVSGSEISINGNTDLEKNRVFLTPSATCYDERKIYGGPLVVHDSEERNLYDISIYNNYKRFRPIPLQDFALFKARYFTTNL